MRRTFRVVNRSARSTSKHERGSNALLSVTPPSVIAAAGSAVTLAGENGPSRCYAQLEPWLWLANLALRRDDGRLLLPEVARHNSSMLEELWDRVEAEREARNNGALAELFRVVSVLNVHHSFQEKFEWLCGLTFNVAYVFEACVKGQDAQIDTGGGIVTIDICGGRVNTAIADPYRDFLAALEGAERKRCRKCPICGRLFYAARLTRQACSRRCNQTRRVRQWRHKQGEYELSRKFKLAGVRPKQR